MKSRKQRKTLPILLTQQPILLLGAGNVALQKAKVLFENNIDFSIISKEVTMEIGQYCAQIQIKKFKRKDIQNHLIVIDATGSEKVHAKLLKHKQKHPLLLNVVDEPALCDFYFMALTHNAPLQIAVSSSGVSPRVAQHFRDKCQALLPEGLDTYMETLQEKRAQGVIESEEAVKGLDALSKQAYLLGCGLGDAALLTRKAYAIIQKVDIVLYDHLISEEIMATVPEHTQKVFVGKQKGFHTKPQDEINALILSYIQEGFSVARLKSGDPFIFGRGAEELQYLIGHGINTEVVPGISSAISAPLLANIPLTARGLASAFTVVSAHLKGSAMNLDWIDQLKQEAHTVVVLMGLSRAKEIQEEALLRGIDPQKPCAIISNASRPNETLIVTCLKDLALDAKKAKRPAIIVFGEVVHFPQILKENQCLS